MEIVKEVWKTIKGHEKYNVSNLGRIKNQHGKILKVFTTTSGYNRINFYTNGKKNNQYMVHRLVLKAFVGDLPEGKEVHHINHNPFISTIIP